MLNITAMILSIIVLILGSVVLMLMLILGLVGMPKVLMHCSCVQGRELS